MSDGHQPILDIPRDDLLAWLAEHGQPRMRYRQIRRWLIAGRAETFEHMTDLPKLLREKLVEKYLPLGARIEKHQESRDGTHKLLLRLIDDHFIECVLLQEDDRRTVCISTQVGCGMGCVFCASGLEGVVRNLTVGEIVEQLIRLRNLLPVQERLSHIVVMGMGEPLANLDNLLAALEIAGDREGFNIGARHITISTVGLPTKIRRLAELQKQYHLAVSLHAPNNDLRSRIVPTNVKTGLDDILTAADEFFQQTGRQVTFEYVVLGGINDRFENARELSGLLKGRQAHVNLIPFNEVDGLEYKRPSDEAIAAFTNQLKRAGISVKVRKRKGSEIDAACGQLRRRIETTENAGRIPLTTQ